MNQDKKVVYSSNSENKTYHYCDGDENPLCNVGEFAIPRKHTERELEGVVARESEMKHRALCKNCNQYIGKTREELYFELLDLANIEEDGESTVLNKNQLRALVDSFNRLKK